MEIQPWQINVIFISLLLLSFVIYFLIREIDKIKKAVNSHFKSSVQSSNVEEEKPIVFKTTFSTLDQKKRNQRDRHNYPRAYAMYTPEERQEISKDIERLEKKYGRKATSVIRGY